MIPGRGLCLIELIGIFVQQRLEGQKFLISGLHNSWACCRTWCPRHLPSSFLQRPKFWIHTYKWAHTIFVSWAFVGLESVCVVAATWKSFWPVLYLSSSVLSTLNFRWGPLPPAVLRDSEGLLHTKPDALPLSCGPSHFRLSCKIQCSAIAYSGQGCTPPEGTVM